MAITRPQETLRVIGEMGSWPQFRRYLGLIIIAKGPNRSRSPRKVGKKSFNTSMASSNIDMDRGPVHRRFQKVRDLYTWWGLDFATEGECSRPQVQVRRFSDRHGITIPKWMLRLSHIVHSNKIMGNGLPPSCGGIGFWNRLLLSLNEHPK
jgi:hypothetical protein